MIQKILRKIFNVTEEESEKFTLLFFHSFFLGIFISVYYTLANSVFIQHFDSSFLASGYLMSGVVGYLLTSLYSFLQKKYQPQKVFLVSLLLLLSIVLFIWSASSFLGAKTASFITFVMAIPFMAIIGLESGGLVMRLLNIKQIKRLFGPITTGSTIATVIGYLSIPIILTFPLFSNPFHLLIVAALGLIISISLLLTIDKKFGSKQDTVTKHEEHEVKSIRFYLKDKFFVFMAMSVILSGIANYFSDFIFLSSLKSQEVLVSTPEGRANFLALAYGSMKIGELVVSYLSGKIFSQYGMRILVSVLPFVSLGLVTTATMTGLIGGAESTLLFIFILMNKSFDNLLRKSLNDPVYKLLYQSLPTSKQLDVQTKIGMIAQIAIIISGALLMLVNLVFISDGKVNTNLFFASFLPLLLIWAYLSRKVFKSYRLQLRKLLLEKEMSKSRHKQAIKYGSDVLLGSLAEKGSEVSAVVALILAETNPNSLSPYIQELYYSKDERVAINALTNTSSLTPLDELHCEELLLELNHLKLHKNARIADLAEEAIQRIDPNKAIDYDKTMPRPLRRIKEDYILLKKTVFNSGDDYVVDLLKLLKSNDKKVKKAAIGLASRKGDPVLVQQLLNILYEEEYSRTAISEIRKLGDSVIDKLQQLINDEGNVKVILRIIELFTSLATPKAMHAILLLSNYPDRRVWVAVIKSLKLCRYQSDEEGRVIIKNRIAATVSHILWINVAILDLSSEKSVLKITQALEISREMYYDVLFDLLSMIYDWSLIDLIKKNFVGEENIFALELIENFISKDIKALIVPLFEGIPVAQQIKRLWELSPQRLMPAYDRLKDIVNKDFNRVDPWTKVKALEMLAKNTKGKLPEVIISCLFHHKEIIWSTAARIVFEKMGQNGIEILERANIDKRFIRNLNNPELKISDTIVNRLKFVKRTPLFFGIPESELLKLAEIFNIRQVGTNVKIPLNDDVGEKLIIIVVSAKLSSENGVDFNKKAIVIPAYNVSNSDTHLTVKSGGLILEAKRNKYFNLVADEALLAKAIVSSR